MNKEDYILRAIGKTAVSISDLQAVMAESIRELMTNDYEMAQHITGKMGYVELLKLLNVLFRYRISNENALSKFSELVSRLDCINSKRNSVIHDETFIFEVASLRKKVIKGITKQFKIDIEYFDLPDILKFVNDIQTARYNLLELFNENREAIIRHRRRTMNRDANKVFLEKLKTKRGLDGKTKPKKAITKREQPLKLSPST